MAMIRCFRRSTLPRLHVSAIALRFHSSTTEQRPFQRPLDLSELRGGVAVVTGAAGGIGFGIARKCREMGMHVCLSDVNAERLAASADSLVKDVEGSGEVADIVCDVTSQASVAEFLAKCRDRFSSAPIQFLGANAGVLFTPSTVLTGTEAEWETTFKVNVLGARNTISQFVPFMLSQEPSHRLVVNLTASGLGLMAGCIGPYGPSKLASVGILEALYSELAMAQHLDRMNLCALCPSGTSTDLLTSATRQVPVPREHDAASKFQVGLFEAIFPSPIALKVPFVIDRLFIDLEAGKFYSVLNHMNPANLEVEGTDADEAISMRAESIRTRAPPKPLGV